MDSNLAKKRNEVLIHTPTLMHPENIMLNQRNQAQNLFIYDYIYMQYQEQENSEIKNRLSGCQRLRMRRVMRMLQN